MPGSATLVTVTTASLTRRPAPARRRAAFVAAVGASVLLSGCAVMSPVQTDELYLPSNGVSLNVGSTALRGLVIVASDKDGPGTLVGQVVNSSGQPVQIAFATGQQSQATTTVPANTSVSMSSEGTPVTVPSVPVPPGGMAQVVISTPQAGQSVTEVPVLPPVAYYESFAPKK